MKVRQARPRGGRGYVTTTGLFIKILHGWEWPRRSDTTLIGTRSRSRRLAWASGTPLSTSPAAVGQDGSSSLAPAKASLDQDFGPSDARALGWAVGGVVDVEAQTTPPGGGAGLSQPMKAVRRRGGRSREVRWGRSALSSRCDDVGEETDPAEEAAARSATRMGSPVLITSNTAAGA